MVSEVIMPNNFGKLKERIKFVYGNQETFADALGCTLQTVNNKLNGKSEFKLHEILNWMEVLNIDAFDFSDYFYG